MKMKKAEKVKPKIRCWKMKKTSCQEAFKQEVTRILGGKNGLLDEWDKTVEMVRKTAETVLGVIFGETGRHGGGMRKYRTEHKKKRPRKHGTK